MGIQRHLRPLRVHQATSRLLEVGVLDREPPWYRIVSAIPPSTSLVRVAPEAHRKSNARRQLFRPQRIIYEEDQARQRFYSDHPWELARPRMVIENDGNDHVRYNWQQMMQPGKPLDGESVVQREMWLRRRGRSEEGERISAQAAYNIARREFYHLRMRQDIERRIAAEEARSVGAYFGKSHMEIGLEQEHATLVSWKERATKEVALKKQRRAATFSSGLDEEEEEHVHEVAGSNTAVEEPTEAEAPAEPSIPPSI